MLTFWIIISVLGLVVYLNIGYLAGHFNWRICRNANERTLTARPLWLEAILWPYTHYSSRYGFPFFFRTPIVRLSYKAYTITMASCWVPKLLLNLVILLIIAIVIAVSKTSSFITQAITWPTRKLIEKSGEVC